MKEKKKVFFSMGFFFRRKKPIEKKDKRKTNLFWPFRYSFLLKRKIKGRKQHYQQQIVRKPHF